MKEQYVIKTRNDEEEYLAWNTRSEQFYLTNTVKFAEKVNSVEMYVSLLHDNVVQVVKSLRKGD